MDFSKYIQSSTFIKSYISAAFRDDSKLAVELIYNCCVYLLTKLDIGKDIFKDDISKVISEEYDRDTTSVIMQYLDYPERRICGYRNLKNIHGSQDLYVSDHKYKAYLKFFRDKTGLCEEVVLDYIWGKYKVDWINIKDMTGERFYDQMFDDIVVHLDTNVCRCVPGFI